MTIIISQKGIRAICCWAWLVMIQKPASSIGIFITMEAIMRGELLDIVRSKSTASLLDDFSSITTYLTKVLVHKNYHNIFSTAMGLVLLVSLPHHWLSIPQVINIHNKNWHVSSFLFRSHAIKLPFAKLFSDSPLCTSFTHFWESPGIWFWFWNCDLSFSFQS